MEQALSNLFSLIQTEIYQPLYNLFANSQWYGNIMFFVNGLLTNIFQMFNDARTTDLNINLLTAASSASICSLLILIWFSWLLVKIFKLSFQTLKKVYLNIVEVGPIEKGSSSKTWRRQWKRKK